MSLIIILSLPYCNKESFKLVINTIILQVLESGALWEKTFQLQCIKFISKIEFLFESKSCRQNRDINYTYIE